MKIIEAFPGDEVQFNDDESILYFAKKSIFYVRPKNFYVKSDVGSPTSSFLLSPRRDDLVHYESLENKMCYFGTMNRQGEVNLIELRIYDEYY